MIITSYKQHLNRQFTVGLGTLILGRIFAAKYMGQISLLSLINEPYTNTSPTNDLLVILVISVIAILTSLILPFINSSRFKNIKIESRNEKFTPEFIRTEISMPFASIGGILGMVHSFEIGDKFMLDTFTVVGIACLIFTRFMFKVKPEEEIPVRPDMDVEMTISKSDQIEADEEITVTYKLKKKTRELPDLKDLGLASFTIRALAAIVDFIIVFILWLTGYNIIVGLLSLGAVGLDLGSLEFDAFMDRTMPLLIPITLIIIPCFYYALFESSDYGASLGKMLFRLKVIGYDDRYQTFWQALKRSLCKHFMFLISFTIIPLYSFFMAAFNDDRQALHDRFAKTKVVKL